MLDELNGMLNIMKKECNAVVFYQKVIVIVIVICSILLPVADQISSIGLNNFWC